MPISQNTLPLTMMIGLIEDVRKEMDMLKTRKADLEVECCYYKGLYHEQLGLVRLWQEKVEELGLMLAKCQRSQ